MPTQLNQQSFSQPLQGPHDSAGLCSVVGPLLRMFPS